jgi:hypothetical protein
MNEAVFYYLIGDYFLEILSQLRENGLMVDEIIKVTEVANTPDWPINDGRCHSLHYFDAKANSY